MIFDFVWHYCDRDVTVMTYKNEPKISVGNFCFPTDIGIWSRFFWFLIYDFWMASKQAITLAFVCGGFWLFPSQKMGCSTQILFNHQISCFKAMPSFYGQKNDLLKCLLFFGSFLVVSHWFFGVTISHLSFFWDCGCSIFFGCCWPFFLRCFIRNTTYFLLGGAKKVLWIF